MAKDQKPMEEMNAMVKQTMEQAYGAADGYFDLLKKSISSIPSGGTEFGEKLKSYAEKNVAATHEFVRKLSQAKDFQDIMQIQTEFMQAQMSAFTEQTKNLGEAYTKAAASAVKMPGS